MHGMWVSLGLQWFLPSSTAGFSVRSGVLWADGLGGVSLGHAVAPLGIALGSEKRKDDLAIGKNLETYS